MSLRIKRGLSNEIPGPQEGELLYTTDTGKLYIGYNDNGSIIPRIVGSTIQDDETPSLGGTLDLNGNNIVGIGNIDIDGYMKATGEINLGDGAEDNVIVGGQISSSLIPNANDLYDLGNTSASWRQGFFSGLNVDGEITANNLRINSIQLQDSTTLFDGDTNTFSVDFINTNTIIGDLTGSIVGEDSEVVLDLTSLNLAVDSLNVDLLESKSETLVIAHAAVDGINIASYKSSLTSPGAFEAGDSVSSLAFQIIEDEIENRKTLGAIAPFLSDNADINSLTPDTEINFFLGNNTTVVPAAKISSKGIISENVIQTGSYDSSSSYPTDAEAGAILFDTSDSHFYGYNGADWVQLDN